VPAGQLPVSMWFSAAASSGSSRAAERHVAGLFATVQVGLKPVV
jgi:hypothetical protein